MFSFKNFSNSNFTSKTDNKTDNKNDNKKYINNNDDNNDNSKNNINPNRTVTIHEYYPTNNYTITMNEFIKTLNNIKTSKNAIDICRSIGLSNPLLRSYALQYGLTYKYVFKGINLSSVSTNILTAIKLTPNPIYDSHKIKNAIAYIKWKIYEIQRINQYNNVVAEWIGMLAGLILYFDEVDEENNKTTFYIVDACKDFTNYDL